MNAREFLTWDEVYASFKPDTEEDAVLIGRHAERIYNDNITQMILSHMEMSIMDAWRQANATDTEYLASLKQMLLAVEGLRTNFEMLIEDGKVIVRAQADDDTG